MCVCVCVCVCVSVSVCVLTMKKCYRSHRKQGEIRFVSSSSTLETASTFHIYHIILAETESAPTFNSLAML